MSDWHTRLRAEDEQLAERIFKLNAFVVTEAFAALHKVDQGLLLAQIPAMTTYRSILSMRIERAGREEGEAE